MSFHREIKYNLLVRKGVLTKELETSAREYIKKSTEGLNNITNNKNYSEGDIITHKILGKGRIIFINESEQFIEISFDNGSTKHIALESAQSVLIED